MLHSHRTKVYAHQTGFNGRDSRSQLHLCSTERRCHEGHSTIHIRLISVSLFSLVVMSYLRRHSANHPQTHPRYIGVEYFPRFAVMRTILKCMNPYLPLVRTPSLMFLYAENTGKQKRISKPDSPVVVSYPKGILRTILNTPSIHRSRILSEVRCDANHPQTQPRYRPCLKSMTMWECSFSGTLLRIFHFHFLQLQIIC